MRGRSLVYDLEQIRSFDFLEGFRDFLKSQGDLAQFLFGPTDTILSGFSAAAKSVPSLYIDLEAGRILQWAQTDTTPYGDAPVDSEYIYQLGYYPAQQILFSKGQLTAGKSQWALVRARWLSVDEIREGDPDGGVHPFWNSANPPAPLQGQNGSGELLPSVRKGIVEISVAYGNPANTGSEVPPQPGTGYVPLYLVNLIFGSTPIGNGDIQTAPAGIEGYPPAPIWHGVRAQHHRGIEYGQAPQIDVTTEITGIVPFPNLPSTSANGLLPTIRLGTVNPNGLAAGGVGDIIFQTNTGATWYCTTAGNAGSAVWTTGNAQPGVTRITTFPAQVSGVPVISGPNGIYSIELSTGDGDVPLPPANVNRRYELKRLDNVAFDANLLPNGTDKIWYIDKYLSSYKLQTGESLVLQTIPALNAYIVF